MKPITLAAALALLALGGPPWAVEPPRPSASQAGEVTTPPPDTPGTPAGTGDGGSGTTTASTGDC